MRRPDLTQQLKPVPPQPGVYQFFDDDEKLLYVGKAKSLRSRVRSYFHESATHTPKVARLVERIARVDWIVTESELEALLLEMNLIKAHRPTFNVTLKDDKRYPFIKIHANDAFPKVEATRKVVRDGSKYYGPYTSAGALYDTLDTLRKVFPYLTCNRTITGEDERACLYHDIGLCAAPCIGLVDREEYGAIIERLRAFLDGRTRPVLRELRSEMQAHSDALEFEQAARVRDRIAAVERVIERQRITHPSMSDHDVVALAREDGSAVAQIFFVRGGRMIGREYIRLQGTEDEPSEEVMAEFIKQFYNEAGQIPGEIVVPEAIAEMRIIESWLADRRGTRVKITVPQRGRKREMVQVAVENAAETLRALQAWHATETDKAGEAVDDLRQVLDLPRPPRRIECFDISNLMGTGTVGSMVVFENAAPLRSDYRRFKVREASGGDDFGAMREVLTRRFKRLERYRSLGEAAGEPEGAFEMTPDLVLIDGGKGQLGVAEDIISNFGLDDVPVASLAKREEELFRPGRSESIRLPRDSAALHLVQRLRDEAHRFAVSYHRTVRRKRGLASTLDEIPGIGAKRRRALLQAFGSLDKIRQADVEDLAAVPGMTRAAAEKVKAYL